MKISEVIKKLENIKKQNGDLEVKCLQTKYNWLTGALIGVSLIDIDKESFDIKEKENLFIGKSIQI